MVSPYPEALPPHYASPGPPPVWVVRLFTWVVEPPPPLWLGLVAPFPPPRLVWWWVTHCVFGSGSHGDLVCLEPGRGGYYG